ncbi:unnamed protein product [Malus baccata var. baccata]
MTGSAQEVLNPSEGVGTRSVHARSQSQNSEPSLAMEQFRRLTRELRETKKTAEDALKKAEARNVVEDGEGGYSGKGSKKIKDVDLREQIEKIVKGYKPQTPAELALEAQMALEGDDEAFLCKLFPSSLSGSSLTWFRQLKSRSIGSFTDLYEAFISQYVCNQRPRKDVTILFSTKQNVGESFKSYMTRFTEEMSTLEECESHTAALAFREGVLPGTKMCRSLIETPPLDMREVMARADGIIRLEEEELIQSKRATATIAAFPADTTVLTLKPTAQPRQERRFSRDSKDGFSERSRLDSPNTKLTVSLGKIFHENKGKGIFRTPLMIIIPLMIVEA